MSSSLTVASLPAIARYLLSRVRAGRGFRGVRSVIVPIIAVTMLNMAAPTFLTAWGE